MTYLALPLETHSATIDGRAERASFPLSFFFAFSSLPRKRCPARQSTTDAPICFLAFRQTGGKRDFLACDNASYHREEFPMSVGICPARERSPSRYLCVRGARG